MKLVPNAVKRTVRLRVVGETPRRPTNAERRPREWLTPDEVERLAAGAKRRGRYGARDAFIVRFAARHGFRVSELCELEWSLVDFATGRLTVNRKKHGLPSTHPLKGWELRELRKLKRDWPESRFVLMTERGAPFTRAGLARMVERAGAEAGFDFPVHFHMLRHATGYNFVNQGMDTRSLQYWLGHVNIAHTIGYTALSDERFKGW